MANQCGVLDGVRVLDLSRGISGSMITMILADHGADVIRIEPPGGDPFSAEPGYQVWNRGKRSAVFDLKNKADWDAFINLSTTADVLVESYAPGVTKRLRIDYETLGALNPRLIYCSITAYGSSGKYAKRPGYDALVAARVGAQWEQRGWPEGPINHILRKPDPFADLELDYDTVQGAPRPGPLFTASRWPSLGAFFIGSTAIGAALRAREITGRGQLVETSLMQGTLAGMGALLMRVERPDAELFDSWIFGARSPKGHFKCADGKWIHHWVQNPRFILEASRGDTINASPNLRAKNDPDRLGTQPDELLVVNYYQPILAEAVRKYSSSDWIAAAGVAGITMQGVRSPEEGLNDPCFLADGCVVELQDPLVGKIRCAGVAYDFSETPGCVRGAAPVIGAHTEEVKASVVGLGAKSSVHATFEGKTLSAPLDGIIVLDLGLALAGPYGTQVLSDFGARVIKINALHDGYWHSNHIAYSANRGKESIAVDLKDPRGLDILLELVKKADVVQHNMRYDAAQRLGIDYENLKKINPALIYCHSRGFEKNGPRSSLPGNDQTGACLTGIQYEDGGMARGGKPLWSLTSFGDTGNGFLTAIAITQALYYRERTGVGQMCDTSIVNAGLLNTSYMFAYPDGSAPNRHRLDGMQYGFHACYRLYETQDGWLCLAAVTEVHWRKLCEAIDMPELACDPRFSTAEERSRNDAVLIEILTDVFHSKNTAEWYRCLDSFEVPCEISDPAFTQNFHDDPEMRVRGISIAYEHPLVGRLEQLGKLCEMSDTPIEVQGPPLIVGDHTRAIMRELGYTDAEITQACEDGYVAAWGKGEISNKRSASPWAPNTAE